MQGKATQKKNPKYVQNYDRNSTFSVNLSSDLKYEFVTRNLIHTMDAQCKAHAKLSNI